MKIFYNSYGRKRRRFVQCSNAQARGSWPHRLVHTPAGEGSAQRRMRPSRGTTSPKERSGGKCWKTGGRQWLLGWKSGSSQRKFWPPFGCGSPARSPYLCFSTSSTGRLPFSPKDRTEWKAPAAVHWVGVAKQLAGDRDGVLGNKVTTILTCRPGERKALHEAEVAQSFCPHCKKPSESVCHKGVFRAPPQPPQPGVSPLRRAHANLGAGPVAVWAAPASTDDPFSKSSCSSVTGSEERLGLPPLLPSNALGGPFHHAGNESPPVSRPGELGGPAPFWWLQVGKATSWALVMIAGNVPVKAALSVYRRFGFTKWACKSRPGVVLRLPGKKQSSLFPFGHVSPTGWSMRCSPGG